MTHAITLERHEDGIVILTLDDPTARANVLTRSLWQELANQIEASRSWSDCTGLILASGKPGIFLAGADLRELGTSESVEQTTSFIDQGLRVLELLESLPFPTAALIDGVALGGGWEIPLACDYRFLGTHPRIEIGMPEVRLGLIPGWGGTQRMSRWIGLEQTQLAIVHAEIFTPERALEVGLADERFPSETLQEQAIETLLQNQSYSERRKKRAGVAHQSVTIPRHPDDPFWTSDDPGVLLAQQTAERVILEGAVLPLSEAIPFETAAFLELAHTSDARRLIHEFFAQRKKKVSS